MRPMARIIYLVSVLLVLAVAEPPRVVDFSYRLKQFELIDTVLDAISVTAKFDQPVFHNVSCANSNDQEKAVYAPCCAYKNVTGCVSSGDEIVPCVDFEHPSLNNTVGYKEWTYFYAHVDNYETCHSVVIENYAIGLSYLAVSVRGIYPHYTNADFLSVTIAGNAQAMCCNEIRRRNPDWNGDLHFGVVGGASSIFDIILWNSTVLPVERFWFLPTVTVTCEDYEFTSKQCDEDLACLFAPPTEDPLFDVARLIGSAPRTEPQSQQFSISLISRQVQYVNIKNSNVIFPFPKSRLYDASCRYYFPSLVNEAGEPLADSIAPPSLRHVQCTQEAYNANLEAVEQLNQLTPDSYADAGEALLQVLPYVTSDNWTACNELVHYDFLEQSSVKTTVADTTSCYELYASDTYVNDSCCNPTTQLTSCCASRDVVATVDSLAIQKSNVQSACSAYRCSLNNLGDYVVLSESSADRRSGCAARSTEATITTFNARKNLAACIQNFIPQQCSFDSTCRAVDINSVCLPSGQCSIVCQEDDDCITGECTTFPYTNITTCRTLSEADLAKYNSTGLMELAVECMERALDPIIQFYVRQGQGLTPTSTRQSFIDALIANGTTPSCQGYAPSDNETECTSVMSCNWVPCSSRSNQYCNEETCVNPLLGSDYFCGACQADLCIEVSTFPHCEYTTVSSDESACTSVGGSFSGLTLSPLVTQRCLANATLQSTCYQPEFCSSATAACASRCYVSDISSQTECDALGSIGGQVPSWTSWTRDGNNYGLCSVSLNAYATCTGADARLRYWPGSSWKSGFFTSQDSCESFGRCDSLIGLYSQDSCTSQSHCVGNEALTDQPACEAQGACDDFTGCVFPLRSDSLDCSIPLRWSPLGCIDLAISNATMCSVANGTWVTKATTKEECVSKAPVCFEMLSSGVLSQRPRTGSQFPVNYSFKSQSECVACGGVYGNYYSWKSSYYWAPRTFEPFQWRQRQMTAGNYWLRAPDTQYFSNIVQAAIGQRFAKILASEMLCRYDQIQSSLQGLVCDCTNTGNTDCYDGLSSSVLARDSLCSGVPDSFSVGDVTISCDTDLQVHETDCLDVKVSVIPISQFQSRAVSSLSATSISSSRAEQRRSALFIKNSAGVAVGQVLGSGVKVETDRTYVGEISVCLTFPSDFTSDQPLELFDYAVPNEDYTEFVPLGWTDRVTVSGTVCVALANTSATYFPIGLQQDWENAAFISTFFPAQVFYLFFGAFMYLLVLAFTTYHFAVHIKMREVGRPFFNLSTSALLILILFLINRFIYMMLIVSGVLDTNGEVEVIFSSFPALLFYVIYSIIVLRWAEIYHFTIQSGQRGGLSKLKPVIIALNSFLTFAFVLLVILYYSLNENVVRVVNCATPDSELTELTRGDIVAIVYKTFYAAVSITLSALFVIYGARVMRLVLKSTKKGDIQTEKRQKRMKAFEKLLAVSCVCTVCLLAQAAFLLWSSALSSNDTSSEQAKFYGILSFLYGSELPPAVIFVVMFKKASFFIKAGRHGTLNGSTGSTNASVMSSQHRSEY